MPVDSSSLDGAWPQPRANLLQGCIRWLANGGPWQSEKISTLDRPDIEAKELILPPVDPARQAKLANRYFSYAEELNQRGAPDLAAAFYRQAYTMLQSSVPGGIPGVLRSDPRDDVHPSIYTPQPESELGEGDSTFAPKPESEPDEGSSTYSPQPESEPDVGSSILDLNHDNSSGLAEAEASTPEKKATESTVSTESYLQQIADMATRLSGDTAHEISDELKIITQAGFRHPELHRLQGLTALHLQDTSMAIEHFREALAIDPMHYSSLVNLGGLLLPGGQHEEAITFLNRALQSVDPESQEALPALANLALAHQAAGKKMDEALLVLRIHRLRNGYIRNERLLTAATTLEQMGEDTSAIELLTWLGEKMPSDTTLRPLASLLERRGEYKEAAIIYRQLLQEHK
jgi:tetratricopeptide (TPR) repeat protein